MRDRQPKWLLAQEASVSSSRCMICGASSRTASWPPGPNVSVSDLGGLDPEHEGRREFLAMVALHSLDGEWKACRSA